MSKDALTQNLTSVAEAIRSKTGGGSKLTIPQMAEAVEGISSGGGFYISQTITLKEGDVKNLSFTFPSPIDVTNYTGFITIINRYYINYPARKPYRFQIIRNGSVSTIIDGATSSMSMSNFKVTDTNVSFTMTRIGGGEAVNHDLYLGFYNM